MSKILATYDYADEAGVLVFQVCRFGKDQRVPFRARRPVRNSDARDVRDGQWVWESGVGSDVERKGLLYRLPEIVKRPDQPVLITEGEKDADALSALGFVATTNAFGAGNWSLEHGMRLRGRRCVVFEDHDLAGQRRTPMVVGALIVAGVESVRIVRFPELPEHGDVSDWLATVPVVKQKSAVTDRVRAAELWGRLDSVRQAA